MTGDKPGAGIMVEIGGPGPKKAGPPTPKPGGSSIADILGGGKPPGMELETEAADVSEADQAIGDAVDAIQAGDRESAIMALRTAIEACMGEYGGGMDSMK